MPIPGEPMQEAVRTTARLSATGDHAFAERPSYKWWMTWTIMLGAFLFALDTTAPVSQAGTRASRQPTVSSRQRLAKKGENHENQRD
jgi:hypothetical protein